MSLSPDSGISAFVASLSSTSGTVGLGCLAPVVAALRRDTCSGPGPAPALCAAEGPWPRPLP